MSCDDTEALSALRETLLTSISGVDRVAVDLEIRNTVREFCTRSNAWLTFQDLTILAGQEDYTITPDDARADIATVIAVAIDGRPIAGWSGSYLPNGYGRQASHYITNPDEMVEDTINTIKLGSTYLSDVEKTMTTTLALRPRQGLLYLPNMLGFDFFDVLVSGVRARMLAHINRPYTEPAGASRARREFLAGLTRARQKSQSRFGKLTVPWTYPQVAAGRRYR